MRNCERLRTKAIEHHNMQLNGRFRLRTRGLENAYSEQKNTMTLITNLFSCPQPSIVWQLGWNRIEIKEERAKSYRKVNRVVSISYQTCTRKASDSRLLSFFFSRRQTISMFRQCIVTWSAVFAVWRFYRAKYQIRYYKLYDNGILLYFT